MWWDGAESADLVAGAGQLSCNSPLGNEEMASPALGAITGMCLWTPSASSQNFYILGHMRSCDAHVRSSGKVKLKVL